MIKIHSRIKLKTSKTPKEKKYPDSKKQIADRNKEEKERNWPIRTQGLWGCSGSGAARDRETHREARRE